MTDNRHTETILGQSNGEDVKMAEPTMMNWTFVSECDAPSDVYSMLVDGENVEAAYETIRDVAVVTNKRLIMRDAQGITGKKVEIYSLPWSSVNMWSSENAGHIDINSELELWTRAGHIKLNLKRGVDIRKLDSIIATYAL